MKLIITILVLFSCSFQTLALHYYKIQIIRKETIYSDTKGGDLKRFLRPSRNSEFYIALDESHKAIIITKVRRNCAKMYQLNIANSNSFVYHLSDGKARLTMTDSLGAGFIRLEIDLLESVFFDEDEEKHMNEGISKMLIKELKKFKKSLTA
jgi:hypothetical protein